MVKIRLARAGAKKRPFYHLVATDSRSPRDSMFIERLGFYNPVATGGEQKLVFDQARIEHWTSKGAQISDRVAYLLKHVPSSPQGGRIEGHVPSNVEGHVATKAEGSAAKAA